MGPSAASCWPPKIDAIQFWGDEVTKAMESKAPKRAPKANSSASSQSHLTSGKMRMYGGSRLKKKGPLPHCAWAKSVGEQEEVNPDRSERLR